MMFECVTLIVFAGLNVFQLIYWSRQNQKLVDKLMSRNYAEYVQANKEPEPKKAPELEVPDDLRILQGIGNFN